MSGSKKKSVANIYYLYIIYLLEYYIVSKVHFLLLYSAARTEKARRNSVSFPTEGFTGLFLLYSAAAAAGTVTEAAAALPVCSLDPNSQGLRAKFGGGDGKEEKETMQREETLYQLLET